ncbi:Cation-transporting P-type ATPase family and Cation-transporting P-type ATPase, N-terminal domain and Neurotransmitter-gated ion-channel transmembrane domain and Cation-transporting P-type ATPase, C-terminal domain and Neurotransmitter-gated ion-channel ligand-binding domain and Cation-transporting P-type ATPase, subfamily V and P-type ATPase, A domain and HAD-like domain and P-type ATPase, cytoplasmic domain N-containing protein [Strongyloides ratti]|uniref:Cation-transporting ATPase n=1 Tax=Strongyloides ratti TaxID=34506 RepID=A0A090LP99_STRRB|nr:Cation-transporting P-type ATPase family and Cation-transporting P-type ATPase, N-terminal domain and Neurotransmitter-gated ion-channel transmembrane domain and Cation-transporting P-type ATPase, C-terminal domain and Neurotransmitter-gated ion-channel ligand-binding domain and Cation-transporting P-type ATPase, subfamily V and P-type ATPase, A domain and HAD-like domain and P-type ATPase, cytoplasmic domain N-containing protein [Strongyloides ratti]CEF71586.1 Cation-transporting P-type ATPase
MVKIKNSDLNSGVPYPDNHSANFANGESLLTFYGYKIDKKRKFIYYIFSIITLGFLPLFCYWYPQIKTYLISKKCKISNADQILIEENKNYSVKNVKIIQSDIPFEIPFKDTILKVKELQTFSYRKINFIWHEKEKTYVSVASLCDNVYIKKFHNILELNSGLDDSTVESIEKLYGKNVIEVKVTPLFLIAFKEFLSPFYIFQVFSVAIWFSDEYVLYASIIVFISIISIFTESWSIQKEQKKLADMVHNETTVEVIRNNGKIITLNSSDLVPGDLFVVPKYDYTLQCDAILISGSCIINESMLTGESVPETKVPLPEDDDENNPIKYNGDIHGKHSLYCGTTIIQTRYNANSPAKAIVLRTGFTTLKGNLVRSIMYPKPIDYTFTKDLLKFVCFLLCVALLGFTYTIILMILRGSTPSKIIIRSLDIITVVVPPALPAAMTIGMISAAQRLKKSKIHCISQETINTCGMITCCCFDKTGTLTEDGLAFNGVRPVFIDHIKNNKPYFGEKTTEYVKGKIPINSRLIRAVATCHSITKINGEYVGDPVDVLNFNVTGFDFKETFDDNTVKEKTRFDMLQPNTYSGILETKNGPKNVTLAVLRTLPFSSALQRMGVIVHDDEDEETEIHFYTKGSPEIISSLCIPESIPNDFTDIVKEYTKKGYRLIAVAYKDLSHVNFTKALKISRNEIENNLKMLGIIVMENKIKPQSLPVIDELNKAGIRTLMITGDNILTAISVARECHILNKEKICFTVDIIPNEKTINGKTKIVLNQNSFDEKMLISEERLSQHLKDIYNKKKSSPISYQLAISGPVFNVICNEYPELLPKIICTCNVFARMTPDQKQFLIHSLIDQSYYVMMCGDGANDCGALKAAHAGISLSTAEASIAAPFTSNINNISCVPRTIREGRAALVTSFGIFKYMAGYSLTQFVSIMLLYWINTNLTDFQFIFIDLGLITFCAIVFGYTPASLTIDKKPPPNRLLSLASIMSVVGQLTIVGIFQFIAFIWVSKQSWFIPFTKPVTHDDDEDKRSMQGTAIFNVSVFQYIALAICYSKGAPYRQSIVKNKFLCILLIIQIGIGLFLGLQGIPEFSNLIDIEIIPYIADRLFIFGIAFISVTCMFLYEKFIVEHLILNIRDRKIKKNQVKNGTSKKSYEKILSKIGNNIEWFENDMYNNKNSSIDMTSISEYDINSLASSHGKQIYVHSMTKNDLNYVKKDEQLSQILTEYSNRNIVNNLETSNKDNILIKNKKKDYMIISEYHQSPIEGNFDSTTTIEPLTIFYKQASSKKEHKYNVENNFDKLDVSSKSSINEINNGKVILTNDYFTFTTEKTITTISKPFIKNNLQPNKILLFKKNENNNLNKNRIKLLTNNKDIQFPTWNFKKISAKIEKTSKSNFYNNNNIVLEKNYESYVKNDLNSNKNVYNNLSYNKNFNKKDNNFFRYLNVKIENMRNDIKNYSNEDSSKEINIKNEEKKINNKNIEDVNNSNNIKDIEKDNENNLKTNAIEIVFDDEEEDDVLTKLFNSKEEKNLSYSMENASIGEHITIEEVQYDENDIQKDIQSEDEYDNDFLKEGEHFDYNETMLTEFINDNLKRDDNTLRTILVDKMLLEKDIPDNTGDYSGSHIYPTLISQNYNNNSLPIMFSDIPVYVMVSLDIFDISSFNMQSMDYSVDLLINMRWYDMRLIHKMNKPITVCEERILEKIWRPDPYIVNAKKSYLHKITFPNIKMRIFPDGLVLYTIHITIQSTCNMKFCMFPHDQQECYLDLSSLSYSDRQLKFIWSDEPYFLVNPSTLPEFKIINITVNECLSHDKLITSSCLRLAFKLRRDSAKYIVEKYIPSTLAMMFAWVAPYVPYNYEDVRIVTPITILLALVQMQKGEVETRTSYLTSLDKWFAVMKVFSVISLMESLVVLSLVRKFRELKKKENKAINEFEKEMIKLQQRQVKKLYNTIDLYARIISPVVFILYLIYYLLFMVTGNEENC